MSRVPRRKWKLSSFADLTPEVLANIERLAFEPAADGSDSYNWCGNACDRISNYLVSLGLAHSQNSDREYRQKKSGEIDSGGDFGHHHWLELSDGTIVDATITQFGTREELNWPGAERVVVVLPNHDFYFKYDQRPWRDRTPKRLRTRKILDLK